MHYYYYYYHHLFLLPLFLSLSLLTTHTTALIFYRAIVPCYDTSRQNDYDTACRVTNELGASDSWATSPSPWFLCMGNAPGVYWNTLVADGLGTCVCGYQSNDGTNWSLISTWGVCNNVCVVGEFVCDGTSPLVPSSTSGAAVGSSSSAIAIPTTSLSAMTSSTVAVMSSSSSSSSSSSASSAATRSSSSGGASAASSAATSTSAATSAAATAASSSSSQSGAQRHHGVFDKTGLRVFIVLMAFWLGYVLM